MHARAALILTVVLPASAALASRADAQTRCVQPAAFLTRIHETVQVIQATTGAAQSVAAAPRVPVCAGDTIRTGDNSRVLIDFGRPETAIQIDQNSEFRIPAAAAGPEAGSFNLLRGALLFISRVRRQIEIRTPFVTAAVQGTEFVVRIDDDRATVTVLEGVVQASTDDPPAMVLVAAGQQAVAIKGQPPQLQVPVRPRDAVQWALYYEPLRPGDSLDQLQQVAAAEQDAGYLARRAALLLSAGQVGEARADLDRAEQLDGANGEVAAVRAIIATALNDTAAALESGRRAVERAPQSALARLALSYAQQASFDLPGALQTMEAAVAVDAGDAAAWARLAELRLMVDDVGGAVAAGERAVSLAPDLPRAHVVRGFTELAQLDLSEAAQAFGRGLELEPGNPLAHLGSGLVKIRRGGLREGRADLERAVSLDPDDALLRSYLGKAYFDERREEDAEQQLEIAKALDPQDPTAFFYSAILKQSVNRPVEALQDLQRAIELNGNRAVYRSRFLLDEDLAARSASLGRVYRDLGFEQLALVEGWRSVQADSSDHSGHRFLADLYSALPRHEIARVSELLQAQLLQPLNLFPVSPRLASTDLFIVDGAGPGTQAFHEFNPLFGRNRIAAELSGVHGGMGVLGGEVSVTGVSNRIAFSVGQFHYDTDGIRVNNDQDRNIFNAFMQVRLSPVTSIQAEGRWDAVRAGDLALLDAAGFSPNFRRIAETGVARVGVRHALSPGSDLIGSAYFSILDERQSDQGSEFGLDLFNLDHRTESWTVEGRHILHRQRFDLTSGVGRFHSKRDRREGVIFTVPELLLTIDTTEHIIDEPVHTNGYVYADIRLPYRAHLTLGSSVDAYESRLFERRQFNPKMGITWELDTSTTLRLGAFRTLHRPLVSSQTIEPTQVAGFNQFFAGLEGEDAIRAGVGIDRRIRARLFGGAEYSWRNSTVPLLLLLEDGPVVQRFDRKEQFGRFYLYWTARESLGIGAEYLVERFDRTVESSGDEGFLALRTHRIPVSVQYFWRAGLSAVAGATYVHQRGVFATFESPLHEGNSFWVVDASFGYRLPRRYGKVSFEVRNLLDERFMFQDTDPGNPVIRPGRVALLAFTVGT